MAHRRPRVPPHRHVLGAAPRRQPAVRPLQGHEARSRSRDAARRRLSRHLDSRRGVARRGRALHVRLDEAPLGGDRRIPSLRRGRRHLPLQRYERPLARRSHRGRTEGLRPTRRRVPPGRRRRLAHRVVCSSGIGGSSRYVRVEDYLAPQRTSAWPRATAGVVAAFVLVIALPSLAAVTDSPLLPPSQFTR